ncbi:MAG TPA: secretin N-terminal domain-containing protein, partial [Phycisphaerales bacterium]|nr:secretin N-terminal domain-containing protein [Phycisphaerales bacterium]
LSAVALAALVGQVAARTEQMAGVKVPGEVLASPGGATVLVVAPGERQAYWRELIARLDQQESVETRTYAPAHFAISDVAQLVRQTIGDGPRLVEDQLTGSLVITATPTQHSAIDDIMTRLAAVPEAVRRPVRAFKVRNRSARDMLTVLESLLAAGALGAAAEEAPEGTARLEDLRRTDAPATLLPGPPGTAPAPHAPIVAPASGVEPPAEGPRPAPAAIADAPASIRSRDQRGRASPARAGPAPDSAPPLSLAADESTSTIIAVGEPRLLDQLGRLIRTLDVRQPQVMLEVLMVSLSDSDALSLGVEIQKELDLEADARGSLASLFGLGLSSPGAPATPGSGFTGLVLSPGNFSVLLRALETLNRGRTVSMPRLLVNNNEAGTFNSILQQPYANTILSNTSTATTFGGTSNAGTQASIRPQIAEGDHLVLEYSISISSFVGSAGGSNLPPPRQENSLESVVTIPDGFTVVLGGLELTSDTSSVSQVPLLGSIPILGEAFKSRDLSTSRSRFFVFIRANVLRNTGFEDLKHLGTVAAQDAGVGDGWPEVGARVIR